MQSQKILVAIVSFIVLLIFISFDISNISYLLLAFLNAEITCIALFSSKTQPYTLHKIVNLFILFFFVFANAIQYEHHSIVSSIYKRLTDEDYVAFQIVVLFILVIFNLSYQWFGKNTRSRNICKKDARPLTQTHFSTILLVAISLFSFFMVLWHFKDNPLYMFIRGFKGDVYDPDLEVNVAGDLLFSKIIRALPFACFVIAANYNKGKIVQGILLILMFFSLFPLSLARNAVAMYWLPVLFLKFNFIKKTNVFVFTLLVGLLVVFPFLDLFRYLADDFSFHYSLDFLNSMHFDASQEFMIIMKEHIVTDGRQLIGVIFFFVPRSIWPTKPIGSGAFVASKYGAFENISMPYFGEGYINFGIIGIIIFTIVLSYACSILDKRYWNGNNASNNSIGFAPYYYALLGAAIFVLRGDLLSSFSFTLGTLFDIALIYYLCKRRTSNTNYTITKVVK